MTRTILDTSALTAPVQCGVRLFKELDRLVGDPEPVVPQPVVVELEGLSADGGEAGTAAAVGRDLVERCRVVATDATYADDAVIEVATAPRTAETGATSTDSGAGHDGVGDTDGAVTGETRADVVAVTNDGPLRDRLTDRGVRVIGLRSGNSLGVTEP